ncbi:MAG: hypothetical protein AAB433_18045 [Nitrospirota bacterium]
MLERFMKQGRSATVTPKEQVEHFNTLAQERAGVLAQAETLINGLQQAEARLEVIPSEIQSVHDDHYRNVVQREVDPSRPDLTESHDQKLGDLNAEQVALAAKVKAYGQELDHLRRKGDRLTREIDLARKLAWSKIVDHLVEEVPPSFKSQFLRLWVALDRLHNGIKAHGVLERIVAVELDTESKVATIEELCGEFGITNQ